MKRALVSVVGLFGLAGGFLVACGGESTDFTDRGDGDGGTTSSTGGSTATGGSKATGGGTSKGGSTSTGGGTSTGGTATGGTGGMPEPPDGICEDITPCGGDPEGAWTIEEDCTEFLLPVLTAPGCEDSPARVAGEAQGTLTFENGVMTQDTTATGQVTLIVSDACAQGLFGLDNITAADVCPLIDAQFSSNPDTPGSCAAAAEGCRCDATRAPMPEMVSATYEITGNQIVLSSGQTLDFCQDGDELHVHGNLVEAMTAGQGQLTLLLARQ